MLFHISIMTGTVMLTTRPQIFMILIVMLLLKPSIRIPAVPLPQMRLSLPRAVDVDLCFADHSCVKPHLCLDHGAGSHVSGDSVYLGATGNLWQASPAPVSDQLIQKMRTWRLQRDTSDVEHALG